MSSQAKCSNSLTVREGSNIRQDKCPVDNQRPYLCPHCDYGAARKTTLDNHMRLHSGERPFQCPHCPYAAKQKSTLVSHMRIHSGERPFQCSFCDYKSARSATMKNHLLSFHPLG